MKTITKLFIVLVLVLATFSHTSSASAGGIFRYRGEGASAFFSSADETGCVWTEVFINPNDGIRQSPPGRGSPFSDIYMYISQYDHCSGTLLIAADGSGSLADPDFKVYGTLDSATLNATVTVNDWVTGIPFDVSIDLTWTGTGSLTRSSSNYRYSSPGCKVTNRFSGTSRPAVATGTVTDGFTNFTPEPSLGNDIYNAKIGELSIGCN